VSDATTTAAPGSAHDGEKALLSIKLRIQCTWPDTCAAGGSETSGSGNYPDETRKIMIPIWTMEARGCPNGRLRRLSLRSSTCLQFVSLVLAGRLPGSHTQLCSSRRSSWTHGRPEDCCPIAKSQAPKLPVFAWFREAWSRDGGRGVNMTPRLPCAKL